MMKETERSNGVIPSVNSTLGGQPMGHGAYAAGPATPVDVRTPTLQRAVEELSRKLAKLTDEKWAKDLEIQDLHKKDLFNKAEISRLNEVCGMQKTELMRAGDLHTDLERLIAIEKARMQSLQEENEKGLRHTKQAHLQEVEYLQETNVSLNQQVQLLSAQNAQAERESTELEERLRSSEHQLMEKDQVVFDAQRRLNDQLQKVEAQTQKAEMVMSQLADTQRRFEQEAARAKELQNFAEMERRAKDEAFERIRALERHCFELGSQIDQASEIVAAFEEALEANRREFEHARKTAMDESRILNEQSAMRTEFLMNQQAQEMANERDRLVEETRRSIEAECAARISKMEGELNAMKHEFELQAESHAKMADEIQNQIETRERGLRQTAEVVTRERSDLGRMAQQLVNDLQMARANHPLKDYLGLAESELLKMQAQLRNTPLHTPERTRLEDSMNKMLKKREFINSVLANSQKHLEDRVVAISSLPKDETKKV